MLNLDKLELFRTSTSPLKSFLKKNEELVHIYEDRNFFTKIGYFIRKFFSSNWIEIQVTTKDVKNKFILISKNDLDSHPRIKKIITTAIGKLDAGKEQGRLCTKLGIEIPEHKKPSSSTTSTSSSHSSSSSSSTSSTSSSFSFSFTSSSSIPPTSSSVVDTSTSSSPSSTTTSSSISTSSSHSSSPSPSFPSSSSSTTAIASTPITKKTAALVTKTSSLFDILPEKKNDSEIFAYSFYSVKGALNSAFDRAIVTSSRDEINKFKQLRNLKDVMNLSWIEQNNLICHLKLPRALDIQTRYGSFSALQKEIKPEFLELLTLEDLIMPSYDSPLYFACMSDEAFGNISATRLEQCNEAQLKIIKKRLYNYDCTHWIGEYKGIDDNYCLKDLLTFSPDCVAKFPNKILPKSFYLLSNSQVSEIRIDHPDLNDPQIFYLLNQDNEYELRERINSLKGDISLVIQLIHLKFFKFISPEITSKFRFENSAQFSFYFPSKNIENEKILFSYLAIETIQQAIKDGIIETPLHFYYLSDDQRKRLKISQLTPENISILFRVIPKSALSPEFATLDLSVTEVKRKFSLIDPEEFKKAYELELFDASHSILLSEAQKKLIV